MTFGSGNSAKRSCSMRSSGDTPVVPCLRTLAIELSQSPIRELAAVASKISPA
ncbi:hypothetical protein [Arsenophonus sp. ENCA]|uniref:hypothetical protein n=1 Tax=Arsenophonus sp. ENCA TaxID=1987579 RepID=UPI0025C2D250|nr:hypothetical protein [Arsenophonus sp. ENCA]